VECAVLHTMADLHLGNVVPNFSANTTLGYMNSFHTWKQDKWAILFSHPADFTPVCTSEVCSLAERYNEFASLNCLVATLSADPIRSHEKWLRDVVAQSNSATSLEVKFPIIADESRDIATAYGMLDPSSSAKQGQSLTIRAALIINPDNRLMLSFNYPVSVGRNTQEIVRCVKALQLGYGKSIATPANWPLNHGSLRLEDGTLTNEYKGSVYLLPTVSHDDAMKSYPNFHTCKVPSKIPYLRLVKLKDLGESVSLPKVPVDSEPATLFDDHAPQSSSSLSSTSTSTTDTHKSETKEDEYMSMYPTTSSDGGKLNVDVART
jgi:peroxiredoxin 6